MGMGCTRVVERVLAAVGALQEAPSRFQAVWDVPNGGVLWALPALLMNGLFRHTKQYFSLPKGFYSLVHIFLLLAYMALCRIKSIEQLRYSAAGELGNLLGLDRIPEVRTLREKVRHLSETGQVRQWSGTLSKEWMEAEPEAAGTLYVDGHVRVYHGSQTKLPRRYVSRERLCVRGTTDYWVNDQQGRPFFVVSTPFTPGLLAMLTNEIVPRLLREVPNQPQREQLEGDPYLHRFTIVFDREGYSPEFFKTMREERIACLTYHKFPKDDWPQREFFEREGRTPHGEPIRMNLAERGTMLSNGLWVREIRKLTKSGHQTSIVSTDYLSEHTSLGVGMFSRWSQENFFRYMMEHFNIDALVDYSLAPVEETKEVVNPAYRALESQIKSTAAKLGRKVVAFGNMTLQEGLITNHIATYETEKGEVKEEIDLLQKDLETLKEKRRHTPRHIPLSELPEQEHFAQLAPRRKQFIDTIKMVAYRAETALADIVRDFLARPDDARSLLRDLFTMEADLLPDEESGTLTVQLHHFTNRLSDKAIGLLAAQLNATETLYPGTNLRLVYKLVSD